MRVAQVYRDRVNGTIAILLSTPNVPEPASAHTVMLRNIYRVARSEMEADAAITHATVSIQQDSAAGAYLVVAEVERPAVFASAIDADPAETLEQRLYSVQWRDAAQAPAPPAPATDAAGTAGDNT
jgi:hypothetical protein